MLLAVVRFMTAKVGPAFRGSQSGGGSREWVGRASTESESPGSFVQNSFSPTGPPAIPGDSDQWGVLGTVLNKVLGKVCVCAVVN